MSLPRAAAFMEPEDEKPMSLTQVTGMGALGYHGVPERVPGMDVAAAKLTPFEGYLLSLVDGATVADDVVAASGLSVLDAAGAFKRLKTLGLMRFRVEADQTAAHRAPDGSLRYQEPASATPKELVVARLELSRVIEAPLQGESDDPGVHLARAQVACRDGDFKVAREHTRLAWVLAPDSPEVQRLRDFLESPAKASERAWALEERGLECEMTADVLGAVDWFVRALAEHESQPHLHHRIAVAIIQAGESKDAAREHLQRALQLSPGNPDVASLLKTLDVSGL